jgi:rhodanese-related sulfurtransferase
MNRLLDYISRHPWLFSAAALMSVAVLINELRLRQHGFSALGPQDAIRLMNQGALLLDLRKPEQFAAGHISGARQMDSAEILIAGETLKKHKEKNIVVYCESGSLGASAARQLAAQGFTKAFNLRGGLLGWRNENLPLVKGKS